MWVFTRYGFFSVATASKRNGELDPKRVMIRARSREHLEALKKRFNLRSRIITLPDRDYMWRIVISSRWWVTFLGEMAAEQQWSNFKDEAERFAPEDKRYLDALHEVWAVMHRVQEPVAKWQDEDLFADGWRLSEAGEE